MDNIFEKISLTLILLKIFDIYFFHYFATNKKIAITHLWHAIEPQTMFHLIAKDKVAEQHILGKYFNCVTYIGHYISTLYITYIRHYISALFNLSFMIIHCHKR